MLIPIPVGLFVLSLVCDIAFRAGAPPLWSEMAYWCMIVGVALLLGSGWLGWALVYEHHVGIATESEIAIASRGQKDHAA